jgi:phosphoribosylformimino-5-aminoimidazole carboxamide ribotide isomerase
MELIPAVDVLDGKVVRLVRGRYDEVTVYGTDPVAQAADWIAQGAGLVHVVDLAGARDGTPDRSLWKRLGAAGVRFEVGGGIRRAADAVAAIDAGAERVVVGTAAVWDRPVLDAMLATVGPERVVAAVDVRDGRAAGAGWLDEGKDVAAVIPALAGAGVVRALVTGIRRDGTMEGPDIGLLEEAAALAPHLQLIASGGVGSLADLEALTSRPFEGVIVGRALYDNVFTVAEALVALG